MPRRAGILLHPTSLPGPYGVGDIGPAAERFLVWLAAAGQSLWQMLPLGPHGALGSPYGAWSSFAANPLLISLDLLADDGLLERLDVESAVLPTGRVDFGQVLANRARLLRRAAAAYGGGDGFPALSSRLARHADDPAVRSWLDDWSLFAALKARLDNAPWHEWPEPLRRRDEAALRAARRELGSEVAYHEFVQLVFLDQWLRLRERAAAAGIELFGDLAIYVALDSADAWAHADLLDLDDGGRPNSVAGVPPDYFSASGQLWGNPLYRWERIAATGFSWWIERIGWQLRLFDLLRIDHFRGLVAYWQIPADADTAKAGRWQPGPGAALFEAVRTALGSLPLVAEDLGIITDEVRELRRDLGIPGMRVLQFAFGDPASEHLPHRLTPDVAVYTGTHDNDTARGWLESAERRVREHCLLYLGATEAEIHWALVRAALTSVADTAVMPLQDVLGLGPEARMNRPGEAVGQWSWRLTAMPDAESADRLRRLTEASGRAAPRAGDETRAIP